MKITKFEHACFIIEKDNKSIIVDPGAFTTDLSIPENVVAIIITHHHGDHLDTGQLENIIAINPQAVIIGPQEVTQQLSEYETKTVHRGDGFALEGFDLDFYGDEHAMIHASRPIAQNIGVLIEDRVYYPGDSFTVPEKSVDMLALPVSAPWLKISESIEFMKTVGARFTFPTHDAILSTNGKEVVDAILGSLSETAATEYSRIDGKAIEIE